MILKYLDFQLQMDGGSKEIIDYCYDFKKSRHILNYIERTCLKKIKFESEFFNGIVVSFRFGFEEKFMIVEPHISTNKSLNIILPLDKIT